MEFEGRFRNVIKELEYFGLSKDVPWKSIMDTLSERPEKGRANTLVTNMVERWT